MTEAEWLASDDPVRMLNHFRREWDKGQTYYEISPRKLRLFAVACCRQPEVWDRLVDEVLCRRCDGTGEVVEGTSRSWPPQVSSDCPNCSGTGRINRSRRAVETAERYADGLATRDEFLRASMDAVLARQQSPFCPWNEQTPDQDKDMAALAVCNLFQEVAANAAAETGRLAQFDKPAQVALLRCIAGNPWRPVTLPKVLLYKGACRSCAGSGEDQRESTYGDCPVCGGTGNEEEGYCPWLTHNDGAVAKLARIAYEQRDWSLLPLIADAMEEAGCPGEIDCDCLADWCNGKKPNPTLAHLRGSGPHARGCHVIDALLGLS